MTHTNFSIDKPYMRTVPSGVGAFITGVTHTLPHPRCIALPDWDIAAMFFMCHSTNVFFFLESLLIALEGRALW